MALAQKTKESLDELIDKYEAVAYIRTCGPAKETRLSTFFEDVATFLFTPLLYLVDIATPIALEFRANFRDDFENGVDYINREFVSLPDSIKSRYEKKAELLLRRFVNNSPDDTRVPEVYFHLGSLYWGRREIKKAIEQFKLSIENDRNNFRTHHSLVLCGQEMSDELIEYFKKAVAVIPNYELGHLCLGIIYERKKEKEKAIEEYKQAPSYPFSHLQLGILYPEQGLDKEAFNELMQTGGMSLEHDPYSSFLHSFGSVRDSVLGMLMKKHSDDLSFVDICEHAIQLDPTNLAPYNCLASAYLREGMFNEAVKTYQRVLEFKQDDIETHRNIGDTYAIMGEPNQAIKSYTKVLEIRGYDGAALWRIGQLFYDNGQYKDALHVWEKLTKQDLFLTDCHGDLAMGEAITRDDLVKKAKEKLRR